MIKVVAPPPRAHQQRQARRAVARHGEVRLRGPAGGASRTVSRTGTAVALRPRGAGTGGMHG